MEASHQSTTARFNSGQDVWVNALDLIRDDQPVKRYLLLSAKSQKRDILSALLRTLHEKEQECVQKALKFKAEDGSTVIVRDLIQKMTVYVAQIKECSWLELQLDPINGAFPWASIRALLRSRVEKAGDFIYLINALEQVMHILSRCYQFERQYLDKQSFEIQTILRNGLAKLYSDILVRLGNLLAIVWKKRRDFSMEPVFSQDDTLELSNNWLDRARQVLRHADLEDPAATQILEPTMSRYLDEPFECQKPLDQGNIDKMRKWLSAYPFSEGLQPLSGSLPSDAGEWLLSQSQYKTWNRSSCSSLLLAHGPKGSIQTPLCAKMVKIAKDAMAAPLAYVSCVEISADLAWCSVDLILRSVLTHLATWNTDGSKVHSLLWSEFERQSALAHARKLHGPTLTRNACIRLILGLLELEPATILIDTIDQLSETDCESLLDSMKALVSKSKNVVKIFLSCQHNERILSKFASSRTLHVTRPELLRDYQTDMRLSRGQQSSHPLFLTHSEFKTIAETLGPNYGDDLYLGYVPKHGENAGAGLRSIVPVMEEHVFTNTFQAVCYSGPETTALSLLQARGVIKTLQGFESTILAATEAGFTKVLHWLETFDFYSSMIIDETVPKLLIQKAIQSGAVDCLDWHMQRMPANATILPSDSIATAVLYGNLEMIEVLSNRGLRVDTEGIFGSPLILACLLDRLDIVRALIRLGADINHCSPFGTPLHTAALKGHRDIISTLLHSGANANIRGGIYGTPLQAAAFNGHLEISKALVDLGAKMTSEGYSHDAFYAALEGGHPDILKVFLESGYNRHHFGQGFISCDGPYRQRNYAALRNSSPSRIGEEKNTKKSSQKCSYKRLPEIECLFSSGHSEGPSENSISEESRTTGILNRSKVGFLSASALLGHLNVAKFLLQSREALEVDQPNFAEAIVMAADNDHIPIIETILEHLATSGHASLTSTMDKIFEMRRSGHIDTLEKIMTAATPYSLVNHLEKLNNLKAQAVPHQHKYETPHTLNDKTVLNDLSDACREGNIQLLDAIFESSNFPQIKSVFIMRGLRQCAMGGYPSLAARFLGLPAVQSRPAVIDDLLISAAGNGKVDFMKSLVTISETALFSTSTLGQAMVHASEKGHSATVRYLVQELSVDVNALSLDISLGAGLSDLYYELDPFRNRPYERVIDSHTAFRITPLQAAIRGLTHNYDRFEEEEPRVEKYENAYAPKPQRENTVEMLLDLGANPNDLGGQESYPLEAALQYGSDSLIKRFINAGADVNASIEASNTLLILAEREKCDARMVQMLLDAGAKLPSDHRDIENLLEKPLAFFTDDKGIKNRRNRSVVDGFRLRRTPQEVFENGPGATIRLLLTVLPKSKLQDPRYHHVLQMAAFINDESMVDLLLSWGVDINGSGYYYGTALQAASRCGHVNMARKLLNAGAQVDIIGGRWETALRAAIRAGHATLVRMLLDHGANVRLKFEIKESKYRDNDRVSSCLQLAIGTGNIEIVRAILEAGYDISDDNADKLANLMLAIEQPPLIMCVERENIDLATLLLDHGADVNVIGRQPWNHANLSDSYTSPLALAVEKQSLDLINLFLGRGADVNQRVEGQRSALALAVMAKNQTIVRLLLRAGADVNHSIWCGSPLTEAVEHDHIGIVKDLLDAGARMDLEPTRWVNPFRRCIQYSKKTEIPELLLEALLQTEDPAPIIDAGLNQAITDRKSDAADLILDFFPRNTKTLIYACSAGAELTVKQLLGLGVDSSQPSDDGDYPIHTAASHLHPRVIETLVDHGADINCTNNRSQSPLVAALESGIKPRLIFLELRKNPPPPTDYVYSFPQGSSLKWAPGSPYGPPKIDSHIIKNTERVVTSLLKNGASPSSGVYGEGGPAIHMACLLGSLDLVEQLLERRADCNEIGGHFKHVLLIALVIRRSDLLTLLLKNGASLNYRHEEYGTPIELARKMDNAGAISLLRQYGADETLGDI